MFSLMLAIMSETNFIESKNKQKYAKNSNGVSSYYTHSFEGYFTISAF